jgi:hypothetical protein
MIKNTAFKISLYIPTRPKIQPFGTGTVCQSNIQNKNLKGGVGEAEDGDWQEDGEHHTPAIVTTWRTLRGTVASFYAFSLFTLWLPLVRLLCDNPI